MPLIGQCKECAEWKERYDDVFQELKEAWRTIATLRQQGFNPKSTMKVVSGEPPIETTALHRAEAPVGDAMVEAMTRDIMATGVSETAARLEAEKMLRSVGSTFTQQP